MKQIYILYVRYSLSGLLTYQVEIKCKWDLFAVIGYLYSTSLEKIERIDYTTIDKASEEALKDSFKINYEDVKRRYDISNECHFSDDEGNEITKCIQCGVEISPHNFTLEDECMGDHYKIDVLKCKDCEALSFGWYKLSE